MPNPWFRRAARAAAWLLAGVILLIAAGATRAAAPAAPPAADPCPPGPVTITGALTSADALQAARLYRGGVPSTCGAPNTCDTRPGAVHYDLYAFSNPTSAAICVTVNVSTSCNTDNFIYSAAYLTAFDPNNICANLVGDPGLSPNPGASYSFTVPPQTTFYINVQEVLPNTGCPAYTVTVSGLPPCSTPEPATTPAPLKSATPLPPGATPPATTPAPTPCTAGFSDVDATVPYAAAIRCLACAGLVSGYPDGSFRPYALLSRGQAAKILTGAAGWREAIDAGHQTFADVPSSSPFWRPVELMVVHDVITGYACGGAAEPCDATNRPYFRPDEHVKRGQLAKLLAGTAGLPAPPAGAATFADVPPGSVFWAPIESAAAAGQIHGYTCGGAGEACDGARRPYFRPYATAYRGQAAAIAAGGFALTCGP